MIRLVPITRKNLKPALKIAYSIFPGKKERAHIKKWYAISANKTSSKYFTFLRYFIAYSGKTPAGITGIYQFHRDPDAWLGYYGVIKEMRRKGIGGAILRKTMELAKRRKVKNLRIYATSKKAFALYKKNKFKKTEKQTWLVVNGKKIFKYPQGSVFYIKKLR